MEPVSRVYVLMNPGDLDQRITIQTFSAAEINASEFVDEYATRVTNDFGETETTTCVVTDIQNIGGVSDDFFGQNNVDFSTLANVWAKVEERSGNEAEKGNQIVATKKVDFIVRYKSNLNEQMRIVYRGNTYKIQSIINEDARKAFMRITTEITD